MMMDMRRQVAHLSKANEVPVGLPFAVFLCKGWVTPWLEQASEKETSYKSANLPPWLVEHFPVTAMETSCGMPFRPC